MDEARDRLDHRPDVHGQVEAEWRTAPPPDDIMRAAMAAECPDCLVNVFVKEHAEKDGVYIMVTAHDDKCPWLEQHEQGMTTFMPPTVKELGDPRGGQATWTLMPAAEGACSQCGRDHDPREPHDRQSLRYSYTFLAEHKREPKWRDAIAHCEPEVQELWRKALREQGVPEEEL